MDYKLRKFLIGFIALTIVLAIYLLYNTINKAPPVDIEDNIADSNIGVIEGEIGKIGDVGVAVLVNPKFIHRNKNREIDRVFGFEELLHQEKGLWQVEKPYMNVYQDSFNCFISADKGEIQVETAVGKPTPKDATFTDNVVIHVLPQATSNIKESFVYLDDVTFISDRTLFFSEGPIEFVSEDARMLGRGLELVYNDRLKRLESLRIAVLESLRLKSSESALLSPAKAEPKQPDGSTGSQEQTPSPTTNQRQASGQQPAGQQPTSQPQPAIQQPTSQRQHEYYKCIFSKNVVIDTPEQLIFADDELSISDIFWSKGSSEKTGKSETKKSNTVSAPDTAVTPTVSSPATPAATASVTKQSQADELSQPSLDTVLTCDGGVFVAPMSLTRPLKSSVKIDSAFAEATADKSESSADGHIDRKKLEDAKGRSIFIANKIDFNASTSDVVAPGRSQLDFYTGGMLADEANQPPTSVKITAQKQTKFLSASNEAVFEGDCLCSMLSSEPNRPEKYTLSATKLTVGLSKDKAKQGSASLARQAHRGLTATTGIEHFTASGGAEIVVSPLDAAQGENDVSRRTKFIAEQIDYIASTNDIVAAGPTELTFYADDITDANNSIPPLPVVITAQKQTKYLLDSRQVIFEGDCLCSMTKEYTNIQQKYNLSAPTITANLASDDPGSSSQIEHLTANGGVVRLATVKSAGEKLLNGIELKCRQFDFDEANQVFVATGQGIIKFTNAVAQGRQERSGRFIRHTYGGFSLRRPCWALFEDFDTLQYYLEKNQIIVDSKTKKINIGYVPIVDGEYDQPIRATAGHVEAQLYQDADGQTDLAELFASGGITFEDDENQFAGGSLFYDHKKAIMEVKAGEAQPCIFNGALVKAIKYNLKTGKVKAKIAGPGLMQLTPLEKSGGL